MVVGGRGEQEEEEEEEDVGKFVKLRTVQKCNFRDGPKPAGYGGGGGGGGGGDGGGGGADGGGVLAAVEQRTFSRKINTL